MSFLLKITAGQNTGSEYMLADGKNMVGRSRSADVRVFNEDVSGKHFTIEIADGVATLQNISGYGTRVDGILVHQSIELRSGQVIEAGRNLKFIFEATEAENNADSGDNDPELTQATKFIGDVQNELESAAQDLSEETSVTKFADSVGQSSATRLADYIAEETSVTRFAADVEENVAGDNIEETSVTRFAADVEENVAGDNIEETSVTRFAADIEDDATESGDAAEQTSVTRFAADVEENVAGDNIEETSVTRFAADINETADGTTDIAEKTAVDKLSDTVSEDKQDKTALPDGSLTEAGTVIGTMFHDVGNETADGSETVQNVTRLEKTVADNSAELNNTTQFFSENTDSFPTGESDDDQGMFFADDYLDDSEKTSSNETQIVQTRMASMDEINFIKSQIKKQQQGRLFFKFLIFSLVVVLLGVVWMLKSPPQEKVLSWPKNKNGYMTKYAPFFELSYRQGGFDIYYPGWEHSKVVTENPNTIVIQSYLGKNAEVPLRIIVQREVSDEFLYESRANALHNALRRLSERKNEQFNFDSSPTAGFLKPESGEWENGIFVEKLAYQREDGNAFFGVLRFFRHDKTNYIIRAEVPAEEKLRALPILNSDVFIAIHAKFVRNHWEGSDEYTKGDIANIIVGVKNELQRNSPMQYPHLEREIKSILAQSLYEKNTKIYNDAKSLLLVLRQRQQLWYNGQKIRWFSAVREKDKAEKLKVRNDCEAVFSVVGDKRRYDILRDHWE